MKFMTAVNASLSQLGAARQNEKLARGSIQSNLGHSTDIPPPLLSTPLLPLPLLNKLHATPPGQFPNILLHPGTRTRQPIILSEPGYPATLAFPASGQHA